MSLNYTERSNLSLSLYRGTTAQFSGYPLHCLQATNSYVNVRLSKNRWPSVVVKVKMITPNVIWNVWKLFSLWLQARFRSTITSMRSRDRCSRLTHARFISCNAAARYKQLLYRALIAKPIIIPLIARSEKYNKLLLICIIASRRIA